MVLTESEPPRHWQMEISRIAQEPTARGEVPLAYRGRRQLNLGRKRAYLTSKGCFHHCMRRSTLSDTILKAVMQCDVVLNHDGSGNTLSAKMDEQAKEDKNVQPVTARVAAVDLDIFCGAIQCTM
jgi:hypothetical protein